MGQWVEESFERLGKKGERGKGGKRLTHLHVGPTGIVARV
jgi:hypothetical protein